MEFILLTLSERYKSYLLFAAMIVSLILFLVSIYFCFKVGLLLLQNLAISIILFLLLIIYNKLCLLDLNYLESRLTSLARNNFLAYISNLQKLSRLLFRSNISSKVLLKNLSFNYRLNNLILLFFLTFCESFYSNMY